MQNFLWMLSKRCGFILEIRSVEYIFTIFRAIKILFLNRMYSLKHFSVDIDKHELGLFFIIQHHTPIVLDASGPNAL